jgi:hypothetical protein
VNELSSRLLRIIEISLLRELAAISRSSARKMDLTETESFCSSNSSDILPKDYSLSSSTIRESEEKEIKRTTSKSMELNFGVDRLLAKCDKMIERTMFDENLLRTRLSESEVNDQSSLENDTNFLHHHLTNTKNFLPPSFVLKPFPLRFGRNENGESITDKSNNDCKIKFMADRKRK